MTEQRLYGPDGGPRKPDRFSQCSKILRVLEDGEPHLVSEIHERAGYSRLNSRVAELRKRGYPIESFHVAGKSGSEGYGYQLCAGGPSDSSPRLTAGASDGTGIAAELPPASPAQMSLVDAA